MAHDTLRARPAIRADFAHFVRLAPELGSGGSMPLEEAWTAEIMPTTLMFEEGAAVVGYTFVQPLAQTGYVQHVVVAPTHRGRGHGMTIMKAAAAFLESRGCTDWCLNVLPTNAPAVRLYERCGMRAECAVHSIRLPWATTDVLPRDHDAVVPRPIDAQEDEAIEATFALPRGQIESLRSRAGRALIGLFSAEPHGSCVALASFDPRFPGAGQFRVRDVGLAAPLLDAIRPFALPEQTHLNVLVENHAALAELLLKHGGEVDHHITRMAGPLPLFTVAS